MNVNHYHSVSGRYYTGGDYEHESSSGSSSDISSVSAVARNSNGWGMRERLNDLSEKVASRTTLSTTGYQTAMMRINNPGKLDSDSVMTMRRAHQYMQGEKKQFPQNTLASLASLQHDSIYRTADGGLKGGIEMSVKELGESLQKCRQSGFSNCDMQALEMGLHIKHCLGIDDFTIYSNKKLSHNYVVIKPGDLFPKGAIVDSWTGHGVFELNLKNKLIFMHKESNLSVNHNMHEFINTHGHNYIVD
ncbi:hypothetical protein [Erwinia mallotivora]|uniref:hypothetical protein n=1 Tax=Erwinia mallotivora TaxID=69222 RepID=UPI0021C14C3D|nr:hypothetical protein [Erwinia mallotivora]